MSTSTPPLTTTPITNNPENDKMPQPNSLKLTLILAATPSLGIGKNGTLPWPQLRKEMGYFARVTKYVPPSAGTGGSKPIKTINAVVMGRKTWDSIPAKFRPLKGRVNVVISRTLKATTPYPPSPASSNPFQQTPQNNKIEEGGGEEGPIITPTLDSALEILQSLSSSSSLASASSTAGEAGPRVEIARTFVIGGAQLYTASLALPQTDRILLTRIRQEFECDTFFPVELSDDVEGGGGGGNGEAGRWSRCNNDEWGSWTGESEAGKVGVVESEAGVGFEFGMWVR
ncbi:unnamed protein product [Periconia digitata]|uniref:Dihydrofolate reductase n=1 Tax=Periconia digitata TaxID=1303443 RepID=A0A9W4UFI6_9PLEO|nr:unnamed protein product [Periconia digitata]